jgi:HAE1 family hydrophobic/amphiphilic exporter-1
VYIYLDRIDRTLRRRLDPQLEEVEEAHPRPQIVAAE